MLCVSLCVGGYACVCVVWVLSEVRVYTILNGTFRAYSLVPKQFLCVCACVRSCVCALLIFPCTSGGGKS